MLYHIRIDYFDNKLNENQTIYCFDISDLKNVEDKVRKYLSGESFLFSGTKLLSDDIRHFRVFQSQYNIERCMEIGDSKIGPNVIWVYTRDTILKDPNICPEITDEIFERVDKATQSKKNIISESGEKENARKGKSKNIFVVHGHNNAIRSEVELLIKKLGYNPIVLFKRIRPKEADLIIIVFKSAFTFVVAYFAVDYFW